LVHLINVSDQSIYTDAFLNLLRGEEALRTRMEHLDFQKEEETITMTLDFRKTAQTGGIEPYYHHVNVQRPWLCGVTNKLKWLRQSNITTGFIYRKINKTGDISHLPLSPAQFSAMFKSNLEEVGLDSQLYDTHSFRRGGAQYFVRDLRWDIPKVCDWGGWSTEWSGSTIFRYLVGVIDVRPISRKDYLDPSSRASVCNTCGRSCNC